jgi:hypothetical protein
MQQFGSNKKGSGRAKWPHYKMVEGDDNDDFVHDGT